MEAYWKEMLKKLKEKLKEETKGKIKVICSCINGLPDCPYCHGKGTVYVQLIGHPYQEE